MLSAKASKPSHFLTRVFFLRHTVAPKMSMSTSTEMAMAPSIFDRRLVDGRCRHLAVDVDRDIDRPSLTLKTHNLFWIIDVNLLTSKLHQIRWHRRQCVDKGRSTSTIDHRPSTGRCRPSTGRWSTSTMDRDRHGAGGAKKKTWKMSLCNMALFENAQNLRDKI